MKKSITKLIRKDKRILVIGFIVLALVISISTRAYVSASDNDGQVNEGVATVPEITAGQEITLKDAIEAASGVELEAALPEDVQTVVSGTEGDPPAEGAGQTEAAGGDVAVNGADTPLDGSMTNAADADGAPVTTDEPTVTTTEEPQVNTDPVVADDPVTNGELGGAIDGGDELASPPETDAPSVAPVEPQPGNDTATSIDQPNLDLNVGDGIALPGEDIVPVDTDDLIQSKQPEIIMIDPGTELTPEEALEPVTKPVTPSKEQEQNDLDNETDRSQEAVFPDGYTAHGDKNTIRLSYEEIMKMLEGLPEGTDVERQMVVLKAYALVGKVTYFWGGKSTEIGWDVRWGNPARVTSAGSKTSGSVRGFGLDCSGYVTWVFNNSAGVVSNALIGDGSSNQWFKSEEISNVSDALPGDLAFFAVPGTRRINHVGVVIGLDEEGRLLVAHCSSSRNNVVITEFRSSGFRFLRRPNIYNDEEYLQNTREMLTQEDIGYAYCWMRSDESAWEQAQVGDLVFKQGEVETGEDQMETGVIRRIDEDGTMWVSKMPYNASSEVFNVADAGYQAVRKPTDLLDQKIKYKLDENNPFEANAFVVMQP